MIEAETGVHIYNAIDDNLISEEDIKALPRVENPRLEIKLEPDNFIMNLTCHTVQKPVTHILNITILSAIFSVINMH